MGPAGPAGPGAPVYRAGWVQGNATIKYGAGFTIIRFGGVAGAYRITVPATTTGKFLVTVVTPVSTGVTARIVAYAKNALNGSHTIDIEIKNASGVLTDSDFNFIAMDAS